VNGGEWLHWFSVDGTFNSETGSAADCNDVNIETIGHTNSRRTLLKSIDLMGRTISENYAGLVIDVFDDGSVHKRVQAK